jgi:hypothetical protein
MPVTVTLTDHGSGVVLKTMSPVSGEEVVVAIESFFRDASDAFAAVRYLYADHVACGTMDADSDHSWRVAAATVKAARTNPNLVLAVCAPTSRAFVLSEIWKTLAEESGWEIRVFRGEQESKAWLRARLKEDLAFT